MNDPTPEHDDLLRRALQSEVEGIEASDELLDRTLAATRRPAVRPSRRFLAAAAVAAVAVGAGVALTRGDRGEPLETINEPTPTVTGEPLDGLPDLLGTLFACDDSILTQVYVSADAGEDELAAIIETLTRDGREPSLFPSSAVEARLRDRYGDDPTALRIIDSNDIPTAVLFATPDSEEELQVRGEVSDLPGVEHVSSVECLEGGGERPSLIALVREDGWLVVVDLETGEERELHFGGDPDSPPNGQEEGGPQLIDSVELSPDGEWVYFSTCCEPAVGTTFRIPVTGGEPTMVMLGAYPRVSPDGGFLATSGCFVLHVGTVDGDASATLEVDECVGHLAWAPDGSQLAATTSVGPDETPQVLLFDWDGTELTPADPGKPDNPGSFVTWLPDGTLNITSGEPVEDDRSLSQDASYRWLLWVDEEGVVRVQPSHQSSEITPIAGVPEALSADW